MQETGFAVKLDMEQFFKKQKFELLYFHLCISVPCIYISIYAFGRRFYPK